MYSGYRPIDCDLHPMVPGMQALTPYMDAFWADQVVERGITTLDSQSWPVASPKTIRADWRGPDGRGAESVERLRGQLLDPLRVETGILNPPYAGRRGRTRKRAVALTRALNDWTRPGCLDPDPRRPA